MVSFSITLMKTSPGPVLALMTSSTYRRVCRAMSIVSKFMPSLKPRPARCRKNLAFKAVKCVEKSLSVTSGSMASETCPMPPRRAASSASALVEMLTPMPPITRGFSSVPPRFRRKSSMVAESVLTMFTPIRVVQRGCRVSMGFRWGCRRRSPAAEPSCRSERRFRPGVPCLRGGRRRWSAGVYRAAVLP